MNLQMLYLILTESAHCMTCHLSVQLKLLYSIGSLLARGGKGVCVCVRIRFHVNTTLENFFGALLRHNCELYTHHERYTFGTC